MPGASDRLCRDVVARPLAAGMIDRRGRLVAYRTADSPAGDTARWVPSTRLAEATCVGKVSRASHASP